MFFTELKEIFYLFFHGKFKELFLTATKNQLLQFCRYVFVGGVASIVDWGVLYLLVNFANFYYLLATCCSFIIGLSCNFLLSKFMVFNGSKAVVNAKLEFLSYCVIGVIGLGFTLVLMFIFTEKLHLYYMLSRIISTVIVLLWNFFARKLILYRS